MMIYRISLASDHIDKGRVTGSQALEHVLDTIQSETFRSLIEQARAADKEEYERIKFTLPAFLPSVLLSGSRVTDLDTAAYTGIVGIDIDSRQLDEIAQEQNMDMSDVMATLCDNPAVVYAFISPSGQGIKGGLLVSPIPQSREEYTSAYYYVEKNLKACGIIIDSSGKNPNRLCYYSYDPNLFRRTENLIPIEYQSHSSSPPPSSLEREQKCSRLDHSKWITFLDQLPTIDPQDSIAIQTWLGNVFDSKAVIELEHLLRTGEPKMGAPQPNERSRSGMVFWFCMRWQKLGGDVEALQRICEDSRWAISQHFHTTKEGTPRKQTNVIQRSIERAMERSKVDTTVETMDSIIEIMNKEYFRVLLYGGDSLVGIEQNDPSLPPLLMSYPVFKKMLIDEGPKAINWLKSSKARRYKTLIFDPDAPLTLRDGEWGNDIKYNLWRGWVYPKASDFKRTPLLEEFLLKVLCNDNQEAFRYLMLWMSHLIQHPGKAPGVALVLRSDAEGTGKSFFASTVLGALCGSHYHRSESLVARFNGETRSCILVYYDEVSALKSREMQGRLNTLITAKERLIEHKGLDIITIPNCLHIIMSSNQKWVVRASQTSRRYFVLEVSDIYMQDHTFFAALEQELIEGGYEQLMRLLGTGECPELLPSPPATKGLKTQQTRSFSLLEEWWNELIQNQTPPEWFEGDPIPINLLYENFAEGEKSPMSFIRFSRALRELIPNTGELRIQREGKRQRAVILPHSKVDNGG